MSQTSHRQSVRSPERPAWLVATLVVLGLWLVASTLLALILSAQEGLGFAWSFQASALDYAILTLLVSPLWPLLRRGVPERALYRALLHAALALSIVPLWMLLYQVALGWLAGPHVVDIYRESSGYWRWLQAALVYGLVVAGMVMVQTGRRLRAQERRASELRWLMREAELRALRAQLRPHFLFNTLNSIYSLIPERPDEAAAMVAMLSDLMRETLELSDQTSVPLGSELMLVERYLKIESLRLGERLTVEVDASEESLAAQVPPFLLQPLVENAIRHGIAPRLEPGEVRVEAQVDHHPAGDRLELVIRDDGRGLGGLRAENRADGNGLRITRSRLKNQYGAAFRLDIEDGSPHGCVVSIRIPFEPDAGTVP